MSWLNPAIKKPEKKKYELTDETIEHKGRTLHRIRAIANIPALGFDIKMGELGGFVESEDNLSQEDTCWIYDDSKVYDRAKVLDFAQVVGNSEVHGNAVVKDFACVTGGSEACGECVLEHDDRLVNGEFRATPKVIYRPVWNGEVQ